MSQQYRVLSLSIFTALSLLSVFYVFQLKFSFDFEDFFPKGDPDLAFFEDFRDKFEADDNFLLLGVRREAGAFDSTFLNKFHDLTLKIKTLEDVTNVQSLTTFSYLITRPFVVSIPAIHLDEPEKYKRDQEIILEDERLVGNLISEDGKTLVIVMKTTNNIEQTPAENLMANLRELVDSYEFEEVHYLGRANFQDELVAMQKREILVSAIVSNFLVSIMMFLIFRVFWGTFISLLSIGLGLLLFMGLMGGLGRELNALSALYPVLMVIVGTSDVIHIMSKYVDELKKGKPKSDAIKVTIREIGLATLLTSITTAVGFASLLSSKVSPIRDFGINSAMGVVVAYITVIAFTTAMVSMFKTEQIIKFTKGKLFWDRWMMWFYNYTKNYPRQVIIGGVTTFALCMLGISMITTNYRVERNLPIGKPITADFKFFEKEFSGFRPFEIAVFTKDSAKADDYEVVREIDKLENHIKSYPAIKAVNSITTLYKSINRANGGNQARNYKMPNSKGKFELYKKKFVSRLPEQNINILISKDQKATRISARVLDVGADSIKAIEQGINAFIETEIDTNLVLMKQTGTGIILDKNSEYIRDSLLWGLGMAILIVSLLMAALFKNIKMVLISLIPNIFPLLIAGAILGFMGIELEAGIAIVFAIIFGIAVDDTIHFLSKYKLTRNKGLDIEESLKVTFLETGKAICLTTVVLFFGFLVMLFSIHPPSVTVGTLISVTLFSALFSDLFLIPVLIRLFLKE